ncbi:signal peptide peptidase SppA [Aneurinibacillus thermoaerophilus]|uniref:signal peptide peptidase SppA n=1 Tax=Aneurinibacillus thermoaerophilus TaxID=143495 RepID=UPI002E1F2049|nr:signal peptide peptidase SppA [Aneurinibacillus thermoaerophilus]MED0678197.1 signal peptide peptidase SppA [Aneurinibacillus thermoaerophilus]MED0765676.1 signal peptide peptidase SppA [Aneurinibacillus thermoaerophilus]
MIVMSNMNKRRWIALAIVVVIVGAALFLQILRGDTISASAPKLWQEEIVSGSGSDKILQLYVEGVISEETSWNSSFDYEALISQLNQGKDDPKVKAFVIRINSPGGAVVPTDELYRKLKQIKAETKKPIVISMGSYAASGGYYIATAGDKIFANPSTLTGSLGVIASYLNYGELVEKYGVKEVVIKSGKFKDIGNPMREMTQDEQALLQNMINESYQQFVSVIAEGRKMPREKVLQLADGRVYTGKQAKANGLVDEFGTLEDATEAARKMAGLQEATVVRYEEPFGFSKIFSSFSAKLFSLNLQSLPDVLKEERRTPSLEYIYRP